MIERYENKEISSIFSDEHKLLLWQRTELAVMKALTVTGQMDFGNFEYIAGIWEATPIDLEL